METRDSTTSTLESQMRLLAERELDQVAAAGGKAGGVVLRQTDRR
jgi:hypothetical protein